MVTTNGYKYNISKNICILKIPANQGRYSKDVQQAIQEIRENINTVYFKEIRICKLPVSNILKENIRKDIIMKDQRELLKKCLVNDTPAIVFQGTDKCALEILQAAEAIYKKNGCSSEFLADFHENVVENFNVFQQTNSSNMKLPDLTESEKEALNDLQEKTIKSLPTEMQDFRLQLENKGFIFERNENTVSSGKYILSNNKEYSSIIGKNGDYEFAINHSKTDNQINYFIFSNDSKYPEQVGDYIDLKNCFVDIMYNHPLQQKKSEIQTIVNYFSQKGYTEVSKVLQQYSSAIEVISESNSSKYTIKNIQICNANGKDVKGDITITPNNNQLGCQLDNLHILDKSTGKIEPLNIGDIDLNRQPAESIKKLLSGNKVEMTDKFGISNLVKLNKGVTGWAISAAKQIVNTADSSAGIY